MHTNRRYDELKCVLSHTSALGESPVWDDQRGRLLWVDIVQGHVHEWHAATRSHVVHAFSVNVGSVALTSESYLIAATNSGFAKLDLALGTCEPIYDPEHHLPNNRFNDGKCDPAGRFWAGTMDQVHGHRGAGALYRMEPGSTASKMIPDVSCSNGLAWTSDSSTMYFIDSLDHVVKAFDYDVDTGDIRKPRNVIEIPPADGIPDGMTIDCDGMLWIALWGGYKVVHYNPNTGAKLDEIPLPVSQVTSCTFGGDTLEDLYITTAYTGLSEEERALQPLAGSLFVATKLACGGRQAVRWNAEGY